MAKVSEQSNTNGALLGCMKAIRGCRTKRMGHVVVLRLAGRCCCSDVVSADSWLPTAVVTLSVPWESAERSAESSMPGRE